MSAYTITRDELEQLHIDGEATSWARSVRRRFDALTENLSFDARFATIDVRDFLLRVEEDGAEAPGSDPEDDRPVYYLNVALSVLNAKDDEARERVLLG